MSMSNIIIGSDKNYGAPLPASKLEWGGAKEITEILVIYQSTYDYVKLYIGYFSKRFPVWEGIFTLNFFFATCTSGTWAPDNI